MTNVATKIPAHYRPAVNLNATALNEDIKSAFLKINGFAYTNSLEISNPTDLKALSEFDYTSQIVEMSKKGKKKLAKHIYKINNHMSINKINSFLRFIRDRFYAGLNLSIKPPKAEQAIIESREKFKKLKSEMLLAKKDYLEKKKSYYGTKYFGS